MNVKRLIASLESAPVGDGDLLGQPFRVLRWQRRFLRGAFRPGIQRAGVTLARGGGKSGLASALSLDSIRPAGALHVDGGRTIVLASSFAQVLQCYRSQYRRSPLLTEHNLCQYIL